MAESIQVQHTASGATVYVLIRNSAGAVWNGAAFETYLTANLGTYAVSLTEQGTASRFYAGAVPGLSLGLYTFVAFVRAGGSPAETDTVIGSGDVDWSGTAFAGISVTVPDSIPADGTRPSVGQAAYMLTQFMLERAVSATTVTVKKVDGSTSLFTLTLDSATTPTSITRAT